ncbi:MAG TPA: hypothetical protein VFI96_03125, partial [Longimicrobiaceae bacterium]|nr:hypothetical protein [Longimicrobiaceae bacterium]
MGGLAYAFLYFPYVLAEALAGLPELSYSIAWMGSGLILWLTLSGAVKPLRSGGRLREQVLRPVVLVHVVFAGYMALTSIFFFLSATGVALLGHESGPAGAEAMARIAAAQRFYVLGHAALATGLLLTYDYRTSGSWRIRSRVPLAWFMFRIVLVATAGSAMLAFVPGLAQLSIRLRMVALVASVLGLALAIPFRHPGLLAMSASLYAMNVVQALLSGWKEEIIVVLGLLAVFAFPFYRRTVMVLTPLVMAAVLIVLPTYNAVFRHLAWQGDYTARQASEVALQVIASGSADLAGNARAFLVGRASEIGTFVTYIRHTPSENDFAGLRIAEQAVTMLMPRAMWPGKPDVEKLVMERVYDNGVVARTSRV